MKNTANRNKNFFCLKRNQFLKQNYSFFHLATSWRLSHRASLHTPSAHHNKPKPRKDFSLHFCAWNWKATRRLVVWHIVDTDSGYIFAFSWDTPPIFECSILWFFEHLRMTPVCDWFSSSVLTMCVKYQINTSTTWRYWINSAVLDAEYTSKFEHNFTILPIHDFWTANIRSGRTGNKETSN